MKDMDNLIESVLRCKKCIDNPIIKGCFDFEKYLPVYSFGNPEGKSIIVIGINPSRKEYDGENPYLSNDTDINKRINSQLNYFDKKQYYFFEKIKVFFEGNVKEKLKWAENPWEKVGYIDLVKCVTIHPSGQWTKLKAKQRKEIIKNCERYLEEQLFHFKPKIIIAYGKDVGIWFEKYGIHYKQFHCEHSNELDAEIMFIPQKQGHQKYSEPEIEHIREEISNCIKV